MSDQEKQICKRCVMDTAASTIVFDKDGECNFCKLHDGMDKNFPLHGDESNLLPGILNDTKAKGNGKKYDCVLGISGGRDSTYLLYLAMKWKLNPMVVHFNDGWGNPVCGENMKKATDKLGMDFKIVTSDWRESKDIKIAFLKASVPEMDLGTDLGIAATLYSVAAKENIKTVLIGNSYRTEGIMPLIWSYMDGTYLHSVHKKFGSMQLRKWKSEEPGFNMSLYNIFYYTVLKGIKTIPILNYVNYRREEVGGLLETELDWKDTKGRYFDDLYHGFMSKILREKFNVDFRKTAFSALIRSGQMSREDAIEELNTVQGSEDPKIISLAIERLGITEEQLNEWLAKPTKTFKDYKTDYDIIKLFRLPIYFLSRLNILPPIAYDKYFHT